MNINSNQILLIQTKLFIFFTILLYLVHGFGYITNALPFIMVFSFVFVLIYLVATHIIFEISSKFRQEFVKTHRSLTGFVLKYRILFFFNLLFYGYLLLFTHHAHHQIYFHDFWQYFRIAGFAKKSFDFEIKGLLASAGILILKMAEDRHLNGPNWFKCPRLHLCANYARLNTVIPVIVNSSEDA